LRALRESREDLSLESAYRSPLVTGEPPAETAVTARSGSRRRRMHGRRLLRRTCAMAGVHEVSAG
jgi:hypothetical protein